MFLYLRIFSTYPHGHQNSVPAVHQLSESSRLSFRSQLQYLDETSIIMKICLCNIQRLFSGVKENFIGKNDVFNIFAQNIDCGYTLESPRRGGSNEYPQSMFWNINKKNKNTLANPKFCYIKVGYKWVYITRTCYREAKLQSVRKQAHETLRKLAHAIYSFKN